jgi:hypothetical protein
MQLIFQSFGWRYQSFTAGCAPYTTMGLTCEVGIPQLRFCPAPANLSYALKSTLGAISGHEPLLNQHFWSALLELRFEAIQTWSNGIKFNAICRHDGITSFFDLIWRQGAFGSIILVNSDTGWSTVPMHQRQCHWIELNKTQIQN